MKQMSKIDEVFAEAAKRQNRPTRMYVLAAASFFIVLVIVGLAANHGRNYYKDASNEQKISDAAKPTSTPTASVAHTSPLANISNNSQDFQCHLSIAKDYEDRFNSQKQFTLRNHELYITSLKKSFASEKVSRPNDVDFLNQKEYELEVETIEQTNEFLREAYDRMIVGINISKCTPNISEPIYFSLPPKPAIVPSIAYIPLPTFQTTNCTSQVKAKIESEYQAALNTASAERNSAISQAMAINAYSGSGITIINNLYNQEVGKASGDRYQKLLNAGCEN